MHKAVLIYNPVAGTLVRQGPDFIPGLLAQLRELGIEALHVPTTPDRTAREIAASHIATTPWIIVAGGDGTVGEAAKALIRTDARLGIIPLGTYNNIARSLGIPFETEQACQRLAAGRVSRIDAGLVNGKHLFFEAAGVGLDAAVFPLGEEIKQGNWMRSIEAAGILSNFEPFRAKLTLDHEHPRRRGLVHRHRFSVNTWMILCANGPFYGPACEVSPGTQLDDGLLTIHLFSKPSRWALLFNLLGRIGGRGKTKQISSRFPVTSIEIEGSKAQPVHLDGMPLEEWPVKIESLRSVLNVVH